jgi:hypothetical protein
MIKPPFIATSVMVIKETKQQTPTYKGIVVSQTPIRQENDSNRLWMCPTQREPIKMDYIQYVKVTSDESLQGKLFPIHTSLDIDIKAGDEVEFETSTSFGNTAVAISVRKPGHVKPEKKHFWRQ